MNISELVNHIHSGDLTLKDDEVHIWYGCNTPAYRYMEMMRRVISDYELNKAYKFFFSRDRERFIIIRAVLRILISKYQNVGINEIRYMKNNFGKPYIMVPKGHAPLKFNISHSNSAFIMAFTRNREIGVDIEKIRSDFPAENIARLFFSRSEIEELLQMQGRQLTKAFFGCWTKKEAYIKAKGMGLSIDLSSFDVSVAADKPAQLI
ncbi:MAG: 4'-phosphopantetheinyl transferase family protein, partial [Syntrophothermus sp.]